MKKLFSTFLALCLLIALLPVLSMPAEAASGSIEKCLQFATYYNQDTEEFDDYVYPAVLVKNGKNSLVITALEPKDGWITLFKNPADGYWYDTQYVQTWNKSLHMYAANPDFGENEGFLPIGSVTQNEKVKLIGFNKDSEPVVVDTVAVDYKPGQVILKDTVDFPYTMPVLNSQNEIFGILYKGICMVFATDEETFYGGGGSQEEEPPADPPENDPPENDPAETEPDETNPPETDPPETNPPETDPPENDPPETEDKKDELAEDARKPVDLQDLDMIYAEAVIQKKPNQSGTIAIGVIAVLVVVLLAGVVIIRQRNKKKVNEELNEAEEGTELADVPVDTGLRLQFRSGKRIAVKRNFTIGRAPDNDVVIPSGSSSVSGHHCEVIVQNGAAYLRDLGSTNGTFINGRRLATGQLVQLLPGMNVSLGGANSTEAFVVAVSSKQM